MSNKIKSNEDAKNRTLDLLKNNKEWETRYKGYADSIEENEKKYRNMAFSNFQVNRPLMVYTSIGKVIGNSSNFEYDLRFGGRSVGLIKIQEQKGGIKKYLILDEGKVTFLKEKGFDDYLRRVYNGIGDEFRIEEGKKKWTGEWIDVKGRENISTAIRSFFCNNETCDLVKRSEHRIESDVLKAFDEKTAGKKILPYIVPVKLGGKYFQLSTPLKASSHNPEYSNQYGGGIDILARVTHKKSEGGNRIAIIELKDENKATEPQKDVMFQALIYATFIAKLLRSESGNKWYKIFGKGGEVPAKLHLDVVTLMPSDGVSGEGCLKDVQIEELKTVFHLYTLYFKEDQDNGNVIKFEGTLPPSLRKK